MKKNGFTLVELIATLALLAMLTTLISRVVIKKVNEAKAYERNVLINSIELAAITYTNEYDNVDLQTNDCAYITLQELVEKNLLNNDLIDPTTKKSLALSDTVYVTKDINGNKYATYNINQHYETTLKLNGKYNVYVKINDVYNEPGVIIISKDESGTTVNRNGLYLEIPEPESNRVESMTYELVQYGTDLSSGQLVLKIGFNLDREAIKEEGKFEFEMTAMSTFSEAFTGNEDRDYSKLNKEIYDIVTNNSGISKVENQLDGLSETITITNDYLIYTLESKEYKFK